MSWTKLSEVGAGAVEKCPKCHVGTRIESTYEHGGVTHRDDYCSYCGRNWRARKAANMKDDE